MLEITAGQFVRFMFFGLILAMFLVSVYIGFTSLYLKQQMQAASDLLSSTGGYMRTEQQQRQWWSLTHNPIMQLSDVHYVGVTDEDKAAGITSNKIDRGVPERLHDGSSATRFSVYNINDSGIGSKDGTVSGTTFDEIEDRAKRSSGGVALNGPTGVRVNEKMLANTSSQKNGYMMVPAHYGTSIRFVISCKIPVWFINGGNGADFDKATKSFISNRYEGQTASLRGNDNLYVSGKNQQQDQQLANVQARALGMLKLVTYDDGVDNSRFGFGQLGVDLDSTSKLAYENQIKPLLSKWNDKIQSDKTQDQIVSDTRSALVEINNVFTQNGGVFVDPDSHKTMHYQTIQAGLSPQLVFRATNGQQFLANTLPNDYHLWPVSDD